MNNQQKIENELKEFLDKKFSLRHTKEKDCIIFLNDIWSNFLDSHVQDLLDNSIYDYCLSYNEKASKINFSFFSTIRLYQDIIKNINKSIHNKDNQGTNLKVSKSVLNKVKELETEYPSLKSIISNDKKINKIKYDIGSKYRKFETENILILGESGTGKQLIARSLGETSKNFTNSFIELNCAAIPNNLLENELFGYEEGAHGTASQGKEGKIEAANDGVLFLDEIGELGLESQAKLLKVIEDKEVVRLGGTETRRINFKLICATNRDLQQEVHENRFRLDLYNRINVIQIRLPPLKDRYSGDIEILIKILLDEILNKWNDKKQISKGTIERMKSYSWPGNIRQLKNLIKKYYINSDGFTIDIPDSEFVELKTKPSSEDIDVKLKAKYDMDLIKKRAIPDDKFIEAFNRNNGNKSAAARELGVHYQTVRRRLKKFESE